MSSDAMLNIKEVVDRNVQYATLGDLQKKGKQRFKVMKLGQFYSLIERAVANVVERGAVDLAEKDRQAIIEESNREFKRLFKERQEERAELQRKEEELQALRDRVRSATTGLEDERRRREDLERSAAQHTQEMEQRLHQEVTRVRAQSEVQKEGESQLRQELQHARTEADTARADVQRLRAETETARSEGQRVALELESVRAEARRAAQELEAIQQRYGSEVETVRAEGQRVAMELESERQRRQALEDALSSTREHADTLGRDLEGALREKDAEIERLRSEGQSLRETLQTEQGKVSEMDQMLRLAQERVESGRRESGENERAREQLEQTCRELDAQLREARSEATAVARRAQEQEARAATMAQEKGALSEDTRKLQEAYAAAERGRVEALERCTVLEGKLREATGQLAEARARLDAALATAEDRGRVIEQKDEQLQTLRDEGTRLAADRDRAIEASQSEESERARALREDLGRLSQQLAEEKDQHQSTMKELLEETRAQKELFSEVRELRAQLDESRSAEGSALAGLSAQLGGVAPILGEIQKTLEEGVPGKPGDTGVEEQIQSAIAMGMETIKDQINLHINDVNEKRKKQIELKAVEAAGVALDRIFSDQNEISTNVEVVEVRQRKGAGIGDSLAKLKAMRATAGVESDEGDES